MAENRNEQITNNNGKNRIELSFEKATTRLAYFPYGKETYEKQVKPFINFADEHIYIVFPEQIVKAASSFVQGFFEEIIKNLGYEAIGNQVIVESPNQSLIKSIMDNLI